MKLKRLRAIIKEEIKRSLNEAKLPQLQTPSDVSYYDRDWGEVFKAWANRHNVDYGPRESQMYDWKDRSHYDDAVKEYHSHMEKVAKKFNEASKGLEDVYKVWNKIIDKYRRKDGS